MLFSLDHSWFPVSDHWKSQPLESTIYQPIGHERILTAEFIRRDCLCESWSCFRRSTQVLENWENGLNVTKTRNIYP